MGLLMLLWCAGLSSAVLLVGMWGHSVISGLMFLVVGLMCEVSGARLIVLLRGLAAGFGASGLLLVLCLANAAFPGTVLFWPELISGAVACSTVPVLGLAVIVCSGLCLLSGLWVWHTLSR